MIKVSYHPGEDAVFIHVGDRESVRTEETEENVFVDYDDTGQVVAYDIQDAHEKAEVISRLLESLAEPVTFVVHGTRVEKVNEFLQHSF